MDSIQDMLNNKIEEENYASENNKFLFVFKYAFYVLIALVFVGGSLFVQEKTSSERAVASLDIASSIGDGSFSYQDSVSVKKIESSYSLQEGQTLITDKWVKGEIILKEGSILRLDENSKVKVLRILNNEFGRKIFLQVLDGKIWINNLLSRDQFNVFSKYVEVNPVNSSFSFSYDSSEKDVEIFSDTNNVLVSFLSKKMPPSVEYDKLPKNAYLNQIMLPEYNKVLISEHTITDNFLQAKYLKLLKNVKMTSLNKEDFKKYFSKEDNDWYLFNKDKDDQFYKQKEKEAKQQITRFKGSVNIESSTGGFSFDSFKQMLTVFPAKKEYASRLMLMDLLYSAKKELLDGDKVKGTEFLNKFQQVYEESKNVLTPTVKKTIFDNFFQLFFVKSTDNLSPLKLYISNIYADDFLKNDEAVLFKLNRLRDLINEASEVMKSDFQDKVSQAMLILDNYKGLVNTPEFLNLRKKVNENVFYLIQERHLLFNFLSKYPELYDKKYFLILKEELEDYITRWSKEVVEEDDNRLYFRLQNLELYSPFVSALKKGLGKRQSIFDLGDYLVSRNEELIPYDYKVDDSHSSVSSQKEFFQLEEFFNSPYFKDVYSDSDFQLYLKEGKYLKNNNESQKGSPVKVKKIDIEKQKELVKKDFASYSYIADQIESLGDSKKILFKIGKVIVKNRDFKGNYNLNGKYMYDIEIDGQLKSGSVSLDMLAEVLYNSSKKSSTTKKTSFVSGNKAYSPAQMIAINDVIDELAKNKIVVDDISQVEIISLEKNQFVLKSAYLTENKNVVFTFRYDKAKNNSDKVELLDSTGKKVNLDGSYTLAQLRAKVKDAFKI